MLKVIGRTWLPAILFAAPWLVLELLDRRRPFVGGLSGIALVVTSLVWWWIVVRNPLAGMRHGAVAGAISALTIVLVVALTPLLRLVLHGPGRGFGVLTTYVGGAMIAIFLVGSIPLGAAVGALAAVVDGRRHSVRIRKTDDAK
jgi:hypothetical protein